MKKLNVVFISILFLLLGIVAVCFVLPSYVNWDKHRGVIESFISTYTGFETKIKGDLEIQVVPNPKFYAENVSIKGFSGKESLMDIEHMIIYKDLKELLSLDFSVNEIVINRPTVNLHISENGNPNWEPLKLRNNRYYSRKVKSFVTKLPTFKKIVIENGNIIYRDSKESKSHDIANIYINANSVASVFDIKSKFLLNNEKYGMKSKIDFSNLANIRLENSLTNSDVIFDIQGVVNDYSNFKKIKFIGKSNLKIDDINKINIVNDSFIDYMRKHVDLSNLEIKSDVSYSKNKLTVPNFELKTDINNLKGSFEVENKDEIIISTSLDIEKLKMQEAKELSSDNIKEIMDSTLDFSFLSNLNITSVISCMECSYGDKIFKEANIRASLANNSLIINQMSVKADNDGDFNLTAIASLNNPVGVEIKQEFKKFPLSSFCPEVITDRLKANLEGKVNLSANGNSIKSMIGSLDGSFNLNVTDAELKRINTKNLKLMTKGFLTGKPRVSYNTTVEDMFFEGAIRDGVLRHSDLDFVVGEKAYTSKGKIDLANLTINYRVSPKEITRNDLGEVVKGKITNPEIISDKITPKGVIDAYGRIISRDLVKKTSKQKVKTHFDYQDKKNLKTNVEKYFFAGKK